MKIEGLSCVITGASRGLGAGLAREFVLRGFKLGLCAREQPPHVPGGPVLCAAVDVTEQAAVQHFADNVAERFGKIDVWINNAGVLDPIGPVRDLDAAAVRQHMEVNFMGVFHGTRAFLRHLHERKGSGILINISSGAARNGYAGWGPYCASKAAVDLFTECVQLEEAAHGLKAYSVAPGVIDTAMQERIRETSPEEFPEVERFRQMKRDNAFKTPEWVAARLIDLIASPPNGPVRMDLRS